MESVKKEKGELGSTSRTKDKTIPIIEVKENKEMIQT